jgi:hypothetical protein
MMKIEKFDLLGLSFQRGRGKTGMSKNTISRLFQVFYPGDFAHMVLVFTSQKKRNKKLAKPDTVAEDGGEEGE